MGRIRRLRPLALVFGMADPEQPSVGGSAAFAWPVNTPGGWIEFFHRWTPLVRGAIGVYRLQVADADDIEQQVRMTAFKKWKAGEKFDTDARFANFLRKTANGLCLHLIRKSRRVVGLPEEIPDQTEKTVFDGILPPGLPLWEWIESQIAEADETDRPVLRMRWCDGETFSGIAARLGCSLSAAHGRYTHALENLRACYELSARVASRWSKRMTAATQCHPASVSANRS